MNIEAALKWIVALLRQHDVKFVVSGGLAAHAYGATRPIRDLDFDIANDGLGIIATEAKEHVIAGPEWHTSKEFKNHLLKLSYQGVQIDLAGADDAEIFDGQKWIPDHTDLDRFEMKELFGIQVPVMQREDWVAYKSLSPRPEDLEDLAVVQ